MVATEYFTAALASYLERGGYDKHLRRLRATLSAQLDLFTRALGQHFPTGTRATRPAGGYFLWVELPPDADAIGSGICTAPCLDGHVDSRPIIDVGWHPVA